jgi:DNA-directed RNA polymerase specialized sigma24 family protein
VSRRAPSGSLGHCAPAGSWEAQILEDLGAIVPRSLIESTVAAATRGLRRAKGDDIYADVTREEPLETRRDKDDCLAKSDAASQLFQADETSDRLRALLPDEQRVILALKAAGHSPRELGERLGLSERTIQRVLESLRARARLGDP